MTTATTETPDARLKRLRMRSWRRGIKEMDMILGPYADARLAQMDEQRLTLYDRLLWENDHDLHYWINGKLPMPDLYRDLLTDIKNHAFDS